jgi:hypothetical protein
VKSFFFSFFYSAIASIKGEKGEIENNYQVGKYSQSYHYEIDEYDNCSLFISFPWLYSVNLLNYVAVNQLEDLYQQRMRTSNLQVISWSQTTL